MSTVDIAEIDAPMKRSRETPRASAGDLLEGADAIALELGMITTSSPRGQIQRARRRIYGLAERGGWPIWKDEVTRTICSSRSALKAYIAAQVAGAIGRGTPDVPGEAEA